MIELLVVFTFIVGYCCSFYLLVKHFKKEDFYNGLTLVVSLYVSLIWFAVLPVMVIFKVAKKIADKI